MGNTESGYDNSQDNFQRPTQSFGERSAQSGQPHYYAGSSEQPNYDHLQQPQAYAGSSVEPNFSQMQQPQVYAGSSVEPNYVNKQPSLSNAGRSSVEPRYNSMPKVPYIADNFNALDQVISAFREAGLESSNLILGIDFTKSNEWTGKYSFNRKSLHALGNTPNPYEQAISIIGRTLSHFDEDNLIPCFGFGDATTHDQSVFSFFPDQRSCRGFEEALARYRQILPYLKLSGPTSFAPIINAATDIVEQSRGQYHVLVIVADGQVTRNADTPPGRFSPQEQDTINAIVAASEYPLSIVLIGVGDGPWDAMKHFDDSIPRRTFDNFQFVNFSKIMSENTDITKKETEFALAALMEIPLQYKAIQNIHFNEEFMGGPPRTRTLPPPREVNNLDNANNMSIPRTPTFQSPNPTAPPAEAPEESACPICLTNPKNMAFGCGHLTCKDCGVTITMCPLCREPIKTRLRLYS